VISRTHSRRRSRLRHLFFFITGLIALGSGLLITVTAFATVSSTEVGRPVEQSIGNETCLECHDQPGLSLQLENGETLALDINPEEYAASVHGEGGYACVQCHTTVGDYPHPAFSAADKRDAALQLYPTCERCHIGEYERALDSTHTAALEAGNRNAAICTDCHTAHYTKRLTDPDSGQILPDARIKIPQTCANCHSAIYDKYLTSVHGSALTEESNLDVPTCTDCHGVHNIEDPTTNAFRLESPQLCASCHTDPQRMDKYGLSTQVLETYVADFHGTTTTLFEKLSPDAETNKPVCFDCHGVHDIKQVNDPEKGLHVRQNLLERCQVCHPDATANFPDSWLSHYIPSPEKSPLTYYVNLFYKIFIPGVLGVMAVLVGLDASWRIRESMSKRTSLAKLQVASQDSGSGTTETVDDASTPENVANQPMQEPSATSSQPGPRGVEPSTDEANFPSQASQSTGEGEEAANG
jgi:predicted CXXCH cytochrome family protein